MPKHIRPEDVWVCDSALIIEADGSLQEKDVLERMTMAMREKVGESAFVDCHRINHTKYRVIVYARQHPTG